MNTKFKFLSFSIYNSNYVPQLYNYFIMNSKKLQDEFPVEIIEWVKRNYLCIFIHLSRWTNKNRCQNCENDIIVAHVICSNFAVGFMTAKGELIRRIIYFRRVDFKFQNQTLWYIGMLAFISAVGMTYGCILFIVSGIFK